MGTFLIIFTVLLSLFAIFGSTIMVNYSAHPYYKKTYDLLVSGEYVYKWSGQRQYYFIHKDETNIYTDDDIVFFDNVIGNISIKLFGYNKYIHGGSLTYLDPYTWYWSKKIWKWYDSNKVNFNNDLTKKNDVSSKETPTFASDNLTHYKD